jgi:magnesium transporter
VAPASVRARLFDADRSDRDVDLADFDLADLDERRLLWVDIDRVDGGSLDVLAQLESRLPLPAKDRARIERDSGRARMTRTRDRLHLTLETLEVSRGDGPEPRELDIIAVPDVVVTVHDGSMPAIDRFVDGFDGETRLGSLTAADLLSSIVDEVISGYLLVVEAIDRDIDELDQRALRRRRDDDILPAIVGLRRRISLTRRTLAPHRSALAALDRPEMQDEEMVGRLWPGLSDRLDVALEAVDGLRDALLGTYDIYMGRAAGRANDVMKTLTLLSAILLPAAVLAGIMGMNFKLAFFDAPQNFFVVLGVMLAFAVALLVIARWRDWI